MLSQLKKNALANYANLSYGIVAALLVVPFYINYLGAESYGLVGIFIVMSAWFGLLDMGLSPTLARQAACVRGGGSAKEFLSILRTLEWVFVGISLLASLSIVIVSDWIASHWLSLVELDNDTVSYCISLIGLIIGLRFLSSLYRSGVNGFEDQVWLSMVSITITTLRTFGIAGSIYILGGDIADYFFLQFLVSLLEVAVFRYRLHAYPFLSVVSDRDGFSVYSLKKVSPFALSLAYTTAVWVAVMQLDKLVLSKYLSLEEYGYFTLVITASMGILQIFSPIMQALLPRMTALLSEGCQDEMLSLYRRSTQIVLVIVISFSLAVALNAEGILLAWTGHEEAALWGGGILFWYVWGNAIVALSAFQYNLQNAHGDLRLHVKGATISALIQIPIVVYAASQYGAMGAALTWFGFRLVWFLWWTPIVHSRFIPGVHLSWLVRDILPIVLMGFVAMLVVVYGVSWDDGTRLGVVQNVIYVLLLSFLIVSLGSDVIMKRFFHFLVGRS